MLDEYAGIDGALARHFQNWTDAKDALYELQELSQRSRSEEDFLRTALEDLDALEPKTGEEAHLSGCANV